ncbi:MAG: hypothetical protein ACREJO_13920 [Phycisphaerales bacterium]
MRKARAVRGPAIVAAQGSVGQHRRAMRIDLIPAVGVYERGLMWCLSAANQLAADLPDIVLHMEHCRLRQRLGRCLISSVRRAKELERMLAASPSGGATPGDHSLVASIRQFDKSSISQLHERLAIIGLVRVAVASQHAMLQHLCVIAQSVGRGDDLPVLHGMREECGFLDNRLHAAAQELAAAETPSRFSVAPGSTLRMRASEPTSTGRMQLKLVGRDVAPAPSPQIRLHWRLADS